MKRTTKKIAILGLALAFIGGSFTACSTDEKTFSIKVTLPDGTAAFGTQVVLTGGKEEYVGIVNDEGYTTIQAPEYTYGLSFKNLPGAFVPEASYSTSGQDVEVTLKMGDKFSSFKEGTGDMYDRYEAPSGTYNVTLTSAEDEVFVSLDPDSMGTYAFFTTGNVDTVLHGYDASFATCYANTSKNADNISSKNKNFYQTFEIGEVHYNEQWRETIGIMARSQSYPVTVQLTFMKISDYYTPPVKYERVVVETQEELKKYPEAESGFRLKTVDYDSELVYNETDGFYHIGSANGPVVVVKLTSNPERLFTNGETNEVTFQTVANPEYEGIPSTFYLTFQKEDGTLYNRDYNKLIMETYPQYVNSDGVYGLTEELKEFLYSFIVEHQNDINIDGEVPRANRWLAPCYYYNQEEGTKDKPNILEETGNYSIITPFYAENGAIYYKLNTVGTFTISAVGNAKLLYDENGVETSVGSADGFTYTVEVGSDGFVFGLTSFDGGMSWIDFTIAQG